LLTVDRLTALLRDKNALLPFEIGAFIALEATEALLAGPAVIASADVTISAEGVLRVTASRGSANSEQAARSVIALLAELLIAAGSGVPPMLLELVERGPTNGQWSLSALRDELEASLVPLNRGAARRVLSRLLREAERGGSVHRPIDLPTVPAPSRVDADLDALIGHSPVPEIKVSRTKSPDAELDALLAEMVDDEQAPATIPDSVPPAPPAPRLPENSGTSGGSGPSRMPFALPAEPPPRAPRLAESPSRPPPAALESPRADQMPRSRPDLDLSGIEETKGRSTAWLWGGGFVVLIGALLLLVHWLRPDVFGRIGGEGDQAEEQMLDDQRTERDLQQASLFADHRDRFGRLSVEVTPERAQILLFIGRGPTEARELEKGVAHEFIAIADGRSPSRAMVPPDAQWESTAQGFRYELGMQTGEQAMDVDNLVLGPSLLPREMGHGTADLGTVRVVTTPPGAQVFQLIGFTRAEVTNIRTDQAHELLMYLDGYAPERRVVGPSDWRAVDGNKTAEIRVELVERRPNR